MLSVLLLGGLVLVVHRRRAVVRHRLPFPTACGGPGPRLAVERHLRAHLDRADLSVPVGSAVRVGVVGTAAVALVGWMVAPMLGLLAPVTLVVAAGVGLHQARGRRAARARRELPDLLEAVARSLRSGASVPVALREAAGGTSAAAHDLATVAAEVDAGAPWREGLTRWAERRPHPDVRLVVGTLVVALDAGGTPARAVDGVATTLRDRAEVDRELRALATQARTSAAVVAGAPLAFGAMGALGDERTTAFLFGTPAGLACLVAGIGLDVVGALWMRRIARGPAPA